MKEPGLDGRHRNQDSAVRKKRGEAQVQNLPQPIPGFSTKTTVEQLRKQTGQESERGIRDAVRPEKPK